ncbi:hypothetical protein GCM10009530_19790 [Microbispora corallina]|uniref:DUF1211 domain-containing protein n=1 Tax=Microbispora corallina TaxID=83302 RepID=A0ABQ4FUB2_9ACTN|nr:TMEM175 family protein [Microbispora corallina]GIH38361.1 hypothetical protein Mco01_13610 [Microbispora corallina]
MIDPPVGQDVGAPEPRVRPGLTHERVGVFADAIFAIAITLLALELPRPEREDYARLGAFLGDHANSFVAFAIAFLMLWFTWRAHHSLFDQITRVSQRVLALHVPLLFFVAFLPYTTSVFGEATGLPDEAAGGRALAIALFAANEAILMLCQGAMIAVVLRQGLQRPDANLSRLRTEGWVDWVGGVYWLLTAAVSGRAAEYVPFLWLATPLIAFGVARVVVVLRRRR